MNNRYLTYCLFSFSLLTAAAFVVSVKAKSPIPIETVAPVSHLAAEIDAKIAFLETILASEEEYKKIKEKVQQAAGVIACLAQAIAEHPEKGDCKVKGVALRNAAFVIVKAKDAKEASAAIPNAKSAIAGDCGCEKGKCKCAESLDHNWAKLISMYSMMEEINTRNSKLRRVARRPKGKLEEQLHASTIAVLTIAMHADTHELEKKTDIPKWQEMCVEYQKAMTELAKALKSKEKAKAKTLYVSGNDVCTKCHETFRD